LASASLAWILAAAASAPPLGLFAKAAIWAAVGGGHGGQMNPPEMAPTGPLKRLLNICPIWQLQNLALHACKLLEESPR
jgi:hypothetical protein